MTLCKTCKVQNTNAKEEMKTQQAIVEPFSSSVYHTIAKEALCVFTF